MLNNVFRTMVLLSCITLLPAATVTVKNSSELNSALSSAAGGDVILCSPGSYGTLTLNGRSFSGFVTIRSADPGSRVTFSYIKMENSKYVRFDNIHVAAQTQGSSTGKIFYIDDGCSHVELINSEVHGIIDNYYWDYVGVYAGNSSYVRIENNYIHDTYYAIQAWGTKNSRIAENLVDRTGSDAMKYLTLTDVEIVNNTSGGTFIKSSSSSHVDFMQFQGGSNRVTLRGNVCIANKVNIGGVQGIFCGNGTYNNFLIEQNIMYTSMGRGICIHDGSGNIARYNTVLRFPGDPSVDKASYITLAGAASYTGNIVCNNTTSNSDRFANNSIVTQWNDPDDIAHYSSLFVNAMAGKKATLKDLRPVPGSKADSPNMGAYTRLMELLSPTSVSGPGNTTKADPLPAIFGNGIKGMKDVIYFDVKGRILPGQPERTGIYLYRNTGKTQGAFGRIIAAE